VHDLLHQRDVCLKEEAEQTGAILFIVLFGSQAEERRHHILLIFESKPVRSRKSTGSGRSCFFRLLRSQPVSTRDGAPNDAPPRLSADAAPRPANVHLRRHSARAPMPFCPLPDAILPRASMPPRSSPEASRMGEQDESEHGPFLAAAVAAVRCRPAAAMHVGCR
jgi:hypothetical protein